jgi:F0F1-type ATP synthase membrane subunit a
MNYIVFRLLGEEIVSNEICTKLTQLINPLEQFSVLPAHSCLTSNFTNILIIHGFVLFFLLKMVSYSLELNFVSYVYFQIIELVKNAYFKNFQVKSKRYFSIFLYIFLIIFVNNCFSLLPYSYAITSSLVFDFYVVLTSFI